MNPPVISSIAAFPWVHCNEPMEIGSVRLLPYVRGKLPGDLPHAAVKAGTVEQGMSRPTPLQLARAVRMLFEAVDCVGSQLRAQGDRAGALRAALLLRYLRQSRAADLEADPRWRGGALSGLEMQVSYDLTDALGGPTSYVFENLDKVISLLDAMDIVAKYVKEPNAEPRPAGGA